MEGLPYKGEYAKTGRAGCKLCKTPIEKGGLRLAILVQSRFHDGKDAHWFHSECFFQKHRPPSVGDIDGFESLRYEDQEKIKSKIGSGSGSSGGGKGKGKKEPGISNGTVISNFAVGYAKSGASACVGCENKIAKKEVRISKKDFTSERAQMYGGANGLDRFYHVDCFVKIREDLEYFAAGNELPGFKDLDKEDQAPLKKKLPAVSQSKRKLEDNGEGAAPAKKAKTDSSSSGKKGKGESVEEEDIKKQNKKYYQNRDAAEKNLKRNDVVTCLTKNKQEKPDGGPSAALDLLADIMTFGAIKRCTDCGDGQFMYKSGVGYQCTGYITEFTKCSFIKDGDVDRVPFKVPNDFREHPLFEGKKFQVVTRIIPKHAAPVKGKVSSSTTSQEGPKIVKNPLAGFKFVIFGVENPKEKSKVEDKIKEFGGQIGTKISGRTAAAITARPKYKDSLKEAERAKKYGVPVVSTDFAKNVTDVKYRLADEMSKYLLSDWVKDIRVHLKDCNEAYEKPREEKGKEMESKIKRMRLKDGAVVDPDSGLDSGPYHVYKEGSLFYNCVLNRMSVEEGKNSFYKLQIIESDSAPKDYNIFRAWGRIGTTVGGKQTDSMSSKQDAIDFFLDKYEELTGNQWGLKFVKKPGKYVRLDIDYGQNDDQKDRKLVPSAETSKLPIAVQALIALIFDVDMLKQTMMEFEIDMEKMPLGKISRKQLLEAYSVLSDSFNLNEQEKDERKLKRKIQDVTNRFYTLIPHNFGTQMPPLLDTDELLKAKIQMLDNLMEIEIAYELLAQGNKGEGSAVDTHYKSLKTDIDLLETQSEEYNIIKKYLENTHAPTHSGYTLELEHVFKVVREGEHKRYGPFKDLHNRRLLWHGSRTSNYVGIISQGLRIAPPEAPVTGYMFGKGVYFADMVSKSANYCFTSRDSPTGLLLLCEVALGDMYELKDAKNVVKPPKDMHSVKGLGQTEPDPLETHTFSDGVVVPFGKPTSSKIKNSSLLYNEYIVYDIAQVNIKYLLKVNFNYKKRGW